MKLTYIKIVNKNGEFLTGGKLFVAGGPGSFDVRHFCNGKRCAIKVLTKINEITKILQRYSLICTE
jgi:hypothetical protein